MLRQVTVIKFRPGVSDQDIETLGDGFTAISDIVPGIERFEFGRDMGLLEGAYDYALVIDFKSADDWRSYRDHPNHLAFAERFAAFAESAVRVQYSLDQAPPHSPE